MLVALSIATLAAVGFAGSSLLAVYGNQLPTAIRSYAVAVAAGTLLALSFGDLFPHGLEQAGDTAVASFVGGFALLFIIETFTKGHTHHGRGEPVHHHPMAPFAIGLAIHNAADGFALGIGADHASLESAALGFGVLVHQFPVGLSLAAVLVANRTAPRTVARVAIQLGLVIPLAAGVTAALPFSGGKMEGALTAVAGGVLAYLATAHLLPEAQTEHPGRGTGIAFAATLFLVTAAIFTVLGD